VEVETVALNDLLVSLTRKECVTLLLIVNAALVDRTFLRRFNTAELIERHPVAVAIVLAAFVLGIALA